MHRLGIKLIIATLLAVILAFLLVDRATHGGQRLLNETLSEVAPELDDDLRREIQKVLPKGTFQSILETKMSADARLPLIRDPFAFRVPDESPSRSQQSDHIPKTEDLSASLLTDKLRLKATVIDRHGALAFINDEVIGPGQAILGYTVVHIAAGYVELSRNGTKVYLRLEDGVKP